MLYFFHIRQTFFKKGGVFIVDPELIKILSSHKEELKNQMDSFTSEIKDEMNSFKTEIKGELEIINERLTSVENKCTIIEEEHGKKLDLLLEYASANIEKHEEYDKNFDKINNKLFNHDVKLAIIEGSDLYKKAIKGKGKSNLRNAVL